MSDASASDLRRTPSSSSSRPPVQGAPQPSSASASTEKRHASARWKPSRPCASRNASAKRAKRDPSSARKLPSSNRVWKVRPERCLSVSNPARYASGTGSAQLDEHRRGKGAAPACKSRLCRAFLHPPRSGILAPEAGPVRMFCPHLVVRAPTSGGRRACRHAGRSCHSGQQSRRVRRPHGASRNAREPR